MRSYWICGLALTGAFLAATPIGAAEDLPAALAACRQEPDDAKRLACYDRYAAETKPAATGSSTADAEVATAAGATAAAAIPKSSVDPTPASAAPVAAAPQAAAAQASAGATSGAVPSTAEEKFGYTEAMTRDDETKEPKLEEILATVTQLGTRGRGELVVTLDNGQVWAQKAAQSNFHLKTGDQVRIKAGALGAFLMSKVSSDRSTRVTRVR